MAIINPQKLLGRNKKIQSEVDEQQKQLIASPINIATTQNILKSLAKITQLLNQQSSQLVEIIREVKLIESKSVNVQPQKQLISGPPGPPGPSIKPQQNSKIVEIIKDVKQVVNLQANKNTSSFTIMLKNYLIQA